MIDVTFSQARESIDVLPPRDNSLTFSGPQNDRQQAVVDAMKHAWGGYKRHAWGYDHLKPVSKSHQVGDAVSRTGKRN